MVLPTLAIVGRPNVGKSTIFNRMIGERVSIVEDTPGVTRDRIYGKAEWLGKQFALIDTGGIDIGDEPFLQQISDQAEIAIDEADVILFLTSVEAGVTDADERVAQILYKADKPVVLAVNKVDNPERRNDIYDFYSLGFGEPYPLSGSHGIGLGDVLDAVFAAFPDEARTRRTTRSSFPSSAGRTSANPRWSMRSSAKSALLSVPSRARRVTPSTRSSCTAIRNLR